jgi:hypothetical protein
MRQALRNLYEFIETVPDRLYPFMNEVEGQWVRGRKSYMHTLSHAFETYGPHRMGYKLTCYRAAFHFLGSVIFIVFAALVSQNLFGSETALYVLIAAATIALFFQEFYSHPKRYGQLRRKGVIDWLTWVTPMMIYISIHTF